MNGLAFADPLWLVALLTAPFVALLHHRRRATGALLVSRLPEKTAGSWRMHLAFYARMLAWIALVVALARPQWGYHWEESETEGIDIQVVLDVSGSMAAEDFQPHNRLYVAKEVVREFVRQRPADRIGLTVFGGTALTRSPLTTDRRMLDELVDSVALATVPDGTAIGVALANAASRLADSAAKSKVVLLLTDGVNNAGEIDPLSAAAVAQGLGLKVYAIGIGRAGRVKVPVTLQNPLTGQPEIRRVVMNVEVDEKLLAAIAERTGGRFFRAEDPEALRQVFAEIDRLERTPLAVKRYVRYREGFQPFAWTALFLLLAPLGAAAAGWSVEP